jgi:HemY protein
MKALVWLLAAFALAVALSIVMPGKGDYALLVLHPWRVELSLNLFAVLLVAAFVIGYLLVRVVLQTLRLPAHVRAFRESRREEKGRTAAFGAIQALFEGRFVRAERLAAGAHDLGAVPGLAGLIAARAAQRLREFERRDRWLERAKDGDGDWRIARLVTVAELLLEERRFAEARSVLHELRANGPRHIATLTLLLRAEQGLGNWDEVIRITKQLQKRAAMPPEALESIRVNARVALLSRRTHDRGSLARYWREVPDAERTHPKVAAAAARAFMQLGNCRVAHRIIEEALEKEWQEELALLYGECDDDDALQRIERAERWLRERPGDAGLLLTLGRLCLQRKLWGKAQSYLEASLAVQSTPAAHVALATLFDRLGRTEDANRQFRASADSGLVPEARR